MRIKRLDRPLYQGHAMRVYLPFTFSPESTLYYHYCFKDKPIYLLFREREINLHEEESENLETSQQQVNAEFKFAKRHASLIQKRQFLRVGWKIKGVARKFRTLYDRLTLATAKKVRKMFQHDINRAGCDVIEIKTGRRNRHAHTNIFGAS
jgi:hypothetical protein